jgi:hypothetical protein
MRIIGTLLVLVIRIGWKEIKRKLNYLCEKSSEWCCFDVLKENFEYWNGFQSALSDEHLEQWVLSV